MVLYAILLVALIGIVAVVLDLTALRHDRRASRTTADLAAVAGVMDLDPFFGGSPKEACLSAWAYFLANTPEVTGAADPCSAFDGQNDATCNPAVPIEATQANAGPYSVTITWPVPDTSPLMQSRLNGDFDGAACERLAVRVTRTRGFLFAPLIGSTEGSTGASAVARTSAGDSLAEIASLVVLDPYACEALYTSGQGKVWVYPAVGSDGVVRPGIITVDSAGTQECEPNSPYTIDAKGEQNSEIKAGVVSVVDGRATVDPTKGLIFSHALLVGNAATAFDPSDANDNPPRLAPRPRPGRRVTRSVVDHKYNCKTGYPDYHGIPIGDCPKAGVISPYIDDLRAYIRNDILAPGAAGDFQIYTGPCNTQPLDPPIALNGNWWINCPDGFVINNSVTFGPDSFSGQPGRVVFQGGVNVKGTLSINAGVSGDTYAYLRTGNFQKGDQASLTLHRTFVYINSGRLDFGAGDGTLIWIAPEDGNFEDLALWAETPCQNPKPCKLGGQASLQLIGVFFMPEALPFVYSGQPVQTQTQAQFFTRRLEAGGQGALIMAPDPERNIPTPVTSAYLIR